MGIALLQLLDDVISADIPNTNIKKQLVQNRLCDRLRMSEQCRFYFEDILQSIYAIYYLFYHEKHLLMLFLRKWLIGFSSICAASVLLLVVDYGATKKEYIMSAASLINGNTTLLLTKSANNDLPNHAKECISFYDFLQKGKEARLGSWYYPKPRTNLTLISAYAYSDYSVVTLEADGWYGQKVYCHYFDADWNKLNYSVESEVFPEFSVHCCRHPEAFYMGITENENDKVVHKVPVLDRTLDKPKYKLSVCLAPIYGNESKWLMLAELIEHYKLQGVQHFYVYIKDIDDYSRILIDNYEKSGEIEVVYFKKDRDRIMMDWHIVGVVDCLQRSRHHSRYAIFADLDERILALENQTLAEYIPKAWTRKPLAGMLQFRMTWILRTRKLPDKYEGERTLKNHLPTLVFRNTSTVASKDHTASVLDPRRVVIMDIHDALLYFPGYELIRAPPNKALIRHYRDLQDNFGRDWGHAIQSRIRGIGRFGNYTMTDYPKELMVKLYKNIQDRLSLVYKKLD